MICLATNQQKSIVVHIRTDRLVNAWQYIIKINHFLVIPSFLDMNLYRNPDQGVIKRAFSNLLLTRARSSQTASLTLEDSAHLCITQPTDFIGHCVTLHFPCRGSCVEIEHLLLGSPIDYS